MTEQWSVRDGVWSKTNIEVRIEMDLTGESRDDSEGVSDQLEIGLQFSSASDVDGCAVE
jgi:hypothetical protein